MLYKFNRIKINSYYKKEVKFQISEGLHLDYYFISGKGIVASFLPEIEYKNAANFCDTANINRFQKYINSRIYKNNFKGKIK